MKSHITTLFVVAVMFFIVAGQVAAQTPDTVTVAASPAGNLNLVLNGDTTTGGARNNAYRVYRLYRDSLYYLTGSINVDYNLTIIATDGSGTPPVIAPYILSDNTSPNPFFYVVSGKVALKNLYVLGFRPDEQTIETTVNGAAGSAAVYATGDSVCIALDSCIFDGWTLYGVGYHGKWNSFFFRDCHFRNMIDPVDWFGGQVLRNDGGTAPADTVYMTNNTMFCINGYASCPVAYTKYFVFDHNTVFLNAVNPFYVPQLTNGSIRNNIFYGTFGEAQTNNEIEGGWYDWDGAVSGIISIDTLTSAASTYGETEAGRNILVQNNAYYWPSAQTTFWNTSLMDTLTPPVWMNARTIGMFSDKTTWPGLVESGNQNVDPGFSSSITYMVDSLNEYVRETRLGTLASFMWNYNPNNDLFAATYPVIESLTYTNTSLQTAGTDGLALGDLNWYPSQRAGWVETAVQQSAAATTALTYTLAQNFPNPFNPSTVIEFSLPKQSQVSLKVFNVLGQEVASLVNETMAAGSHSVTFNASNLATGLYFYKLTAGSFSSVKKMMLVK